MYTRGTHAGGSKSPACDLDIFKVGVQPSSKKPGSRPASAEGRSEHGLIHALRSLLGLLSATVTWPRSLWHNLKV